MNRFFLTMGFIVLINGASINAQVTIGADKLPESFSILELISNGTKGLRLPQLTTVQRDAAQAAFSTKATTEAVGLQIFNTTTLCVETWNGIKWIAQCNCNRIISNAYNLCNGSTIADLTTEAGGGVEWYASAVANTPLPVTAPLVSGRTYFAEQIGNCKNSEPRTPVTVVLGDCSVAPVSGSITAFTNVMYDFQKQTLKAYSTGTGIATSFVWEYSTDGTTFNPLPDAQNSVLYNVPAYFASTYFAGSHSKNILFRCALSNPASSTATFTSNFDILFINTTTAGYGTENGVKYLKMNIGDGTRTVAQGSTATLSIALTNLGGNEDNNAGDLGDFYQWGRFADGHQKIGWSRDPISNISQIEPMDGLTTSAVVAYSTIAPNAASAPGNYDNNAFSNTIPFHQVVATSQGYRKFISTDSTVSDGFCQWYNPNYDNTSSNDHYLWGQSNQGEAHSNRYPAKNGNDPCPPGWKVPSRWQFIDIYIGNASGSLVTVRNWGSTGKNNTWTWRGATNNAAGGALVTNSNGEILFLPAAGYRKAEDGLLNGVGRNGLYWSSTYSSIINGENDHLKNAYDLGFSSNSVNAAGTDSDGQSHNSIKAFGFNVRCVKE
jgi:hypothetical protein